MTAPGFCTCKRDFPRRPDFHPPENATWHFLCDKPVLPAARTERAEAAGASPSVWDWDAEAAEREQYADVMAADLADQRRWDRQSIHDTGLIRGTHSRITPTGTGWPADPPEYEPGEAEAQRIAEVFADARAEQDRGL